MPPSPMTRTALQQILLRRLAPVARGDRVVQALSALRCSHHAGSLPLAACTRTALRRAGGSPAGLPWHRRGFSQKSGEGTEPPRQRQEPDGGREPGPEAPAEAPAAEAPAGEAVEAALKEELARAQEQVKAKKNELLLALADFENNKKRFEKEREARRRSAMINFAKKMVEVHAEFDTLPTPSAESSEACRSLYEGVVLVRDLYRTNLGKFDIEQFSPERGQPHSAARHEVVATVEDTELPSNSVAATVRPGWLLTPRSPNPPVLKKAEVKLARHGPDALPPH